MTSRPGRATLLPVARPHIDEMDLASVRAAIESGTLSLGPRVASLERRLAEYLGVDEVVATNSGTAALHLAVLEAGIGPGDEVLVPSLTFASTANVVVLAGGTPVFVDVDPRTLCLDPGEARRQVTSRTRAMIPVHFAGRPADLSALGELCREKRLLMIEDAAHAFGATWKGERIGRHGDFVCFSFHATKPLTTGEGGAVAARSPAALEGVRHRRWYGVDVRTRGERPAGSWWPYDVPTAGFKYNMNDVEAALGLTQLEKVERLRQRREDLARRYLERLSGYAQALEFPEWPTAPGLVHAWHLFIVRLRREAGLSRETFMASLLRRNIATSVHYPPAHQHSLYRGSAALPVTEDLGERIVTLPLFPGMTDADQDDVVDAIDAVLSESASSQRQAAGRT